MKGRLAGPNFVAFQYPLFRLFWFGQLGANVATWMQIVAIGWLVLELTDSPAYLGLNAGLQALPLIAFALVGGVIADRYDRYRLILAVQVGLLLPDTILALLVGSGQVRIEYVLVCSVVSTSLSALSNPARQALVPKLVPPDALLSAVSLTSVLWHGSTVLGPTLAGLVVVTWGLAGNFYLNVVGQLLFLLALLCIRVPATPPERRGTSPWDSLAEGARYTWRQPDVRMVLLLVTGVSLVGRSYPHIMPVFARDVYDVGPQGLGVMLAMTAIGTIVAGFGLGAARELPLARAFLAASAVLALALLWFAASPWFWLALVPLVVVGAALQAATAIGNTMLQQTTDDHLRGRVMSFYLAATWGGTRLGALPLGVLAQVVGAPLAIGLGAAALLAALVPIARGKALRQWPRGKAA